MTPTTIHDLAKRLSVSSTTVWRALNGSSRVSAQTRQRVQAIARKLNYRPSLIAQTLSTGKTQTLGVVVPMIGNPVHAALVRAVEQVAFEHEYNIVLCDTDFSAQREQIYLDLLSRRRVEGVVIVRFVRKSSASLEPLLKLERDGIAVVAMQLDVPDKRLMRVVADNTAAAFAMTKHLIQLGHQRIAFLHGGLESWNIPMRERLTGYRKALRAAGIAFDSKLVVQAGAFESVITSESSDFQPTSVAKLLDRPDRPTAIFAPIDILAIKVMHAVQAMGLSVPRDFAIAGFDDILMSAYTTPALTTVRHPAAQVGRIAAVRLFERLAGTKSKSECERVPCELVIRKSCGAN